jgi:ribosomal protein S18 acetylase RimI-like enzyme
MIIRPAQNESELSEILTLQTANLGSSLSDQLKQNQGFVTVKHRLEDLQALHSKAPQIIAHDGNRVVGYALVMDPSCRDLLPILFPLFESLDALEWKGQPIKDLNYYVMGQICVDQAYRRQGLFGALYDGHQQLLSNQYRCCLTEVSSDNTPSLKAHKKKGFETLKIYGGPQARWHILCWDWPESF